jgi:hypothetical protein
MESVKKEVLIYLSLGLMLVIWAGVLYFTGTPLAINWEAVKKLPDVVTIYVIVSFVFTQWLWRVSWFQGWLVKIPVVEGTWDGELQSTWKKPGTEETIPPLRMILVIRQTFSSMTCTMFTAESQSDSRAAKIERDRESKAVTISYNYTNRSKATIRHRSPIHDGAAHLRVVLTPTKMLEGEYWTGRCTTGTMKLNFRTKELFESFPES